MAENKILLVDDDENLLASFRRQLRKRYTTDIAGTAEAGLAMIRQEGPYALIISDYRMPGMNGIDFLAKVREVAPDTVRIILTGYADVDMAIQAVNEGSLFRLLTKPCPPQVLVSAIRDGMRQWQLLNIEKELLENTLKGSIKVLSELLSIIKPDAYGLTSRIMPHVRMISDVVEDPSPWMTETAARLCRLGYVVLPDSILRRIHKGKPLEPEELDAFNRHPGLAAQLISHIPRLEEVSQMIAYQGKRFDGGGIPEDDVAGKDIPLGARILKVAIDYDTMLEKDLSKSDAIAALRRQAGAYDPDILQALSDTVAQQTELQPRAVTIGLLKEGMILDQHVFINRAGKIVKVLGRGAELTETTVEYLQRIHRFVGIKEPIKVFMPVKPKIDERDIKPIPEAQTPPQEAQ
ncbi:HD domain-containing phosphohydrolase [Oceanidesulfovibrio marinus]|uniref:Histidine kinase n=1 Tax=Oceanidesulfovibrio marinus TaxID=370038 RepID=A0A6P1ZDC5_9BACT|nr:HD domain-containing phosphohydrolase [Oceanidesulfovibrio marinus]TVM32265.1 histidine kinase [Oceanidesulfovibrio marinus]